MEIRKTAQPEPTEEQLRKAEAGLIRLLSAKNFTREWIERQVPDAMAQAQADLATRIAAGREDETVGLLIVIAYRRALKTLSADGNKPKSVPVEEVFDLVDEYARTPEQIVIGGDRQARLLRAMRYLPDREKELLALVYYGDLDVKEAGRRLGWSSSSAERHHKDALAKLRALVGERSLLGADVAVPALIASDYSFPRRDLRHWLEAGTDRISHLAGSALHWLTEGGSSLGMSGTGRTSAGLYGLAVTVCTAAVIYSAVLRVSVFHLPEGPTGAWPQQGRPNPSGQQPTGRGGCGGVCGGGAKAQQPPRRCPPPDASCHKRRPPPSPALGCDASENRRACHLRPSRRRSRRVRIGSALRTPAVIG